jgi:hypothetical protein
MRHGLSRTQILDMLDDLQLFLVIGSELYCVLQNTATALCCSPSLKPDQQPSRSTLSTYTSPSISMNKPEELPSCLNILESLLPHQEAWRESYTEF